MAHNTLMLIAQLSGLRINVLANRLGCDTDLARTVHSKLADVLAEMVEDQRKILNAERVLATVRGTSDEEDSFYDVHHYQTVYYEKWLVETVRLLDPYMVDDFTHEYYNFHTGSWHYRDTEVPIAVEVPAEKLCGLASIIAEIEEISGAWFSVENVYYSEAEAEAAWWQNAGMDPETVFGDEGGRV